MHSPRSGKVKKKEPGNWSRIMKKTITKITEHLAPDPPPSPYRAPEPSQIRDRGPKTETEIENIKKGEEIKSLPSTPGTKKKETVRNQCAQKAINQSHTETRNQEDKISQQQNLHSNTISNQNGKSLTDIRKYFQLLIKNNEEENIPARMLHQGRPKEPTRQISEKIDNIRGLRESRGPDDNPPGPNIINQISNPLPINDNPLRISQLLGLRRRVEPDTILITLPPNSPLDPPHQPANGCTSEPERKKELNYIRKNNNAKSNSPQPAPEGESIKLVPQVVSEGQIGHDDLLCGPSHLQVKLHGDNMFSERNKTEKNVSRNDKSSACTQNTKNSTTIIKIRGNEHQSADQQPTHKKVEKEGYRTSYQKPSS